MEGWRFSLKNKSKTKCKNRSQNRRGDGAESGQLFLVGNVEAFTEQIRDAVSNKKQREQVIPYLCSKRSLEIQHNLNAMRDWIGEREMPIENRRFQVVRLNPLELPHNFPP
jgi:hypothetical protein